MDSKFIQSLLVIACVALLLGFAITVVDILRYYEGDAPPVKPASPTPAGSVAQ
jgi:hypothetical protein